MGLRLEGLLRKNRQSEIFTSNHKLKPMKRFTLIIILFTILVNYKGHSQHAITPGLGFKEIQLGMTIDKILKILGKPASVISVKEEKKKWKHSGYNPKEEFPFLVKFDSAYTFENVNDYAIWKVYAKNNSVVYLNVSSYIFDTLITKHINVLDTIYLYGDSTRFLKKLGNNFYTKADKHQNTEYVYLQQGISFIMKDSQVRNIFLFEKLKANRVKYFVRKLKLHKK